MVINLSSLPQETIEKYDLLELSQDGKVYIEIQKGMYGLPQSSQGWLPTDAAHAWPLD
jgi:hypothetical protein